MPEPQELPLAELLTDPQNANLGTERGRKVLRHSLEKLGAGRSILLDRHNRIIAGNKATEQALAAGLTTALLVETDGTQLVAVRRNDLDLDEPRAREMALSDNRAGELDLSWSPEAIAAQLDLGLDLSALWTGDELEELLRGLQEPGTELLTDPDAIPEEVETRCKPGEVWEAGRHKVACLDSTDPETLKRLFGDDAPGMVFADPPYGVDIVQVSGADSTGNPDIPFGGVKNRKPGQVGGAKPKWGQQVRGTDGAANLIDVGRYAPVIGDNSTQTAITVQALCAACWPAAAQVWWGGNYYANALPPSSCWLVWDKENTGNFADAELAWTNQKTAVRIFRHLWNGMVKASENGEKRVHPTQKPVALAEWVFTTYGEAGGLVFDPFLGSGMSLIAAERLGHRLYGCELSPEYCDVVLARYEAVTGDTARRLET